MPDRSLRHLLGAVRRRVALPTVSVLVVVEPIDRPRLAAALASVRDQDHPASEVLVCPVGGGVGDLPAQPTWQEAARAGASAAHGDLVVHLRGCDLMAPGALRRVAAGLAGRSGRAALWSGVVDQAGEPDPWLARAQREPLRLALVGSAVRRSSWSGPDPDDDWLLSTGVARLLASGAAAVRSEDPACTWFPDHGTRAYGATPSTLPLLAERRDRLAALETILRPSSLAASGRRLIAATEVPRLLQDTERADDAQWAELRSLAAEVVARPGWSDGVGAAARAVVWLAAEDRRGDVAAVAAEAAALGHDLRTVREGDTVLACWPVADLPADVRALPDAETPLLTRVARVGEPGADRRVELLVAVDHLDLADPGTVVEVRTDAGDLLDATSLDPAEATRWLGRRFQTAAAVSVAVPGAEALSLRVEVRVGGVRRHGSVQVPVPAQRRPAPVVVEHLAVDGTALVLTGRGALDRVVLIGPRDRELATSTTVAGGAVRLELTHAAYGDVLPLPPGSYRVTAGADNVSVGAALRARLPEVLRGVHRVRAHLGPRGGLVVELAAPLAEDEAGAHAQQQLQDRYAADTALLDPGLVYFESYAGRTATDSPRAIFDELRARRPDLDLCWGISDPSQQAPPGARPVLLRSREWYDVLARAHGLVLNTDTEVWFRRRPGQVLLQTFHGYPSKAMGRSQWEAKDYPPSKVREFRARGVDTWSAILTPTPEMTRHYREQYDYSGPALEHGYPRDDDLVGPDAATRRDRARARLGIGAHQTAVLYAPTWRDHLASRPRAAEMTEHLDVGAAADALGDDHVLLLRGHRFHAPATTGARVVDVTAYPEINDLILAADAAVLDYSSLRFDFALTGRPMVFLVPDLDEYAAGSRRFLFPFEDSAPGPLVRTTGEVVAALRDPGLAERWAAAIAAFNERYQPHQDGRAAERVVDELERLLDTLG